MVVPALNMRMHAGVNSVSRAILMLVMLMILGRITLDYMQMRARVAVMMMEEGRTPGPLGSGVKENRAPATGRDEDRLPLPASN